MIVVKLVESNSRPCGVQLVSTARTNKNADPMDLVELATNIQKVFLLYCVLRKVYYINTIIKYDMCK